MYLRDVRYLLVIVRVQGGSHSVGPPVSGMGQLHDWWRRGGNGLGLLTAIPECPEPGDLQLPASQLCLHKEGTGLKSSRPSQTSCYKGQPLGSGVCCGCLQFFLVSSRDSLFPRSGPPPLDILLSGGSSSSLELPIDNALVGRITRISGAAAAFTAGGWWCCGTLSVTINPSCRRISLDGASLPRILLSPRGSLLRGSLPRGSLPP